MPSRVYDGNIEAMTEATDGRMSLVWRREFESRRGRQHRTLGQCRGHPADSASSSGFCQSEGHRPDGSGSLGIGHPFARQSDVSKQLKDLLP
jgi:hypothetical protein